MCRFSSNFSIIRLLSYGKYRFIPENNPCGILWVHSPNLGIRAKVLSMGNDTKILMWLTKELLSNRIKQWVSTKSMGVGSSVILRARISEFIKVFMAQAEWVPQLLTALFHKIHVKSGTTSGFAWEQCGLQDTFPGEAGWSNTIPVRGRIPYSWHLL